MALLLRSGAVFLHIPKTGGTWVTQMLRDNGLVRCRFSHKHADLQRVLESPRLYRYQNLKRCFRFGPNWYSGIPGAFKFCFVRNPLDWYQSWWAFMSQHDWPNFAPLDRNGVRQWHPTAELEDIQDNDFTRFLQNVMRTQPGFASRMFAAFATPETNFVGRQENLVEDLIRVLHILNERFDEDRIRNSVRINVSRPRRGRPTWRPEDRQRIAELERDAMQRYNYDKTPAAPAQLTHYTTRRRLKERRQRKQRVSTHLST